MLRSLPTLRPCPLLLLDVEATVKTRFHTLERHGIANSLVFVGVDGSQMTQSVPCPLPGLPLSGIAGRNASASVPSSTRCFLTTLAAKRAHAGSKCIVGERLGMQQLLVFSDRPRCHMHALTLNDRVMTCSAWQNIMPLGLHKAQECGCDHMRFCSSRPPQPLPWLNPQLMLHVKPHQGLSSLT